MRILVVFLTTLSASIGFAQARTKSAPISDRYPIHSILYFTPHKKFAASGDLSVTFASEMQETIGAPTTFEEMQTTSILNEYEFQYGVLPQLAIGASIGYLLSTEKNVSYRDSAGSVGVPLEPDLKESGITDPTFSVLYRPIDDKFVVDLGASLTLSLIGAERAAGWDTNADNRDDQVNNGNAAQGSHSVAAAARGSMKVSDRLIASAQVSAEHFFEGQITVKDQVDVVTDIEAFTVFVSRLDGQFFLTPEFALNPFFQVQFAPQTKASWSTGINFATETDKVNTYMLGTKAAYLLMPQLEVHGSYAWSTLDSSRSRLSTAGGPFVDLTNTRDRDAHTIALGAMYEF